MMVNYLVYELSVLLQQFSLVLCTIFYLFSFVHRTTQLSCQRCERGFKELVSSESCARLHVLRSSIE